MNNKLLLSALAVASIALSGLAPVQARDGNDGGQGRDGPPGKNKRYEDGRGGPRPEQRGPQGDQSGYANDRRGPQPPPPVFARGRGAGPDHNFYRGGRLPPQYRGNGYVVNDWRGHRLSAPPRGYHWVQTGGDYVLVAIATGIILQIFLN
jgi:Ni/Co efflux regulator RcnB